MFLVLQHYTRGRVFVFSTECWMRLCKWSKKKWIVIHYLNKWKKPLLETRMFFIISTKTQFCIGYIHVWKLYILEDMSRTLVDHVFRGKWFISLLCLIAMTSYRVPVKLPLCGNDVLSISTALRLFKQRNNGMCKDKRWKSMYTYKTWK